jgi:hypothetical protein
MNELHGKMDAFLNSTPAANNTKGYAEGEVSANNTNVSANNTNVSANNTNVSANNTNVSANNTNASPEENTGYANAQEGGRRKSRRKSRKNRA